LPLIRHPGNL